MPCVNRLAAVVAVALAVAAVVVSGFSRTASAAAAPPGPAEAAPHTDATPAPPPDILISRQLLRNAHLSVGDIVTLAADPAGKRAARFRIAGAYEPTPDPMKFMLPRLEARVHLPDLIALTTDPADPLAAESVGAINVRLLDPAAAAAFADDFRARSIGLVVRSTARAGAPDPFAVLERFHLAIAAVTVFGSTAFLLALMVIRAEERRETVGVLRLIGISRRSVLLEVVAEGLLVALAGAAVGVIVAAAAQHFVNGFFQRRYDTALVFVRVTPRIALESIAVAVPVGVVAGVVASWTLLRRNAIALVRR